MIGGNLDPDDLAQLVALVASGQPFDREPWTDHLDFLQRIGPDLRTIYMGSNGHRPPDGADTPEEWQLDVVRLDTVQPERVDWLWDGRLPAGKVVILDGDPGLGKSTLSLTLIAHVTTGRNWPDGCPCPRGDAVVLSAEDGLADTIRPRVDTAGGDPARVHAVRAVVGPDPDTGLPSERPAIIPQDLDRIEALVTTVGARIIVVDVLMAYLDGRINSHRDQDVRRALARLHTLAERTGACVVVLRHLNKSGGASALYRGGGSIGIVGAARVGLLVGRDPDDDTGERRALAVSKNNLAPLPDTLAFRLVNVPEVGTARVEWLGTVGHSADSLVSDEQDTEARAERDHAAEWLREHLTDQGGEAPAPDVKKAAMAAGFTPSTIDRARKRAGIHYRTGGFPRRSMWFLPDLAAPVTSQSHQSSQSQGEK